MTQLQTWWQCKRRAWALALLAAVIALLAAGSAGCSDPQPNASGTARPYDIVIEGGRVVDGSGDSSFVGDVAVRGERLARIAPPGTFRGDSARTRIDAAGLVVAPGFIDVNGHSIAHLLTGDGRAVSKVAQGVTTEIMGEGTTPAPANLNVPTGFRPGDSAQVAYLERFGGPRGFARWLAIMEARDLSINAGSFVGGSTVRAYAMGMEAGAPDAAALDTMRAVVRRAMQDGAFGLASALIYPPGSFATTDELAAVSAAMAPYGGVYVTHLRSEGNALLDAVDEALAVGRRAGVPVEIYHLKAAGRRNWGALGAVLAAIDSARAVGQDVQANMYPYAAASTSLAACLPPWASAGGRLRENLRAPAQRARLRRAMLAEQSDWENWCQLATPEGVLLAGIEAPQHQRWEGARLAEVAQARGQHWTETVMDLVAAEGRIAAVYFAMSEANLRRKMRQPWMTFGTDAAARDPDSAEGLTHPRTYGSYPRILGTYVREEGVLPLEDAVRKMTAAPAARFSIEDRGLLREGFYADLVLFDPEAIADRATFQAPHQLPRGVRHVLVNGTPVWRNGRHTGAAPGRVLRGPGHGRTPPPGDSLLSTAPRAPAQYRSLSPSRE